MPSAYRFGMVRRTTMRWPRSVLRRGSPAWGERPRRRPLPEEWRLIDCLRNGLPLDQDVYDAAAWSSIVPLSEWPVLHRSTSAAVPDFGARRMENEPAEHGHQPQARGSDEACLGRLCRPKGVVEAAGIDINTFVENTKVVGSKGC